MSKTYDFEGKLDESQKRINRLMARMERNREWIADRGTYYYPSEAVKALISAMRGHRDLVKERILQKQNPEA